MPDRLIRESITTSASLAKVSLLADAFYKTMHVLPDDYGCFDARTKILRARLYPLRMDEVSDEMIESWLQELAAPAVGMIRLWTDSNGVRYGQLLSFEVDNNLLVKHDPKTPCPPWLQTEGGQDPRIATETLQAYSRIEVAVAKLSSGGKQPTYREIIEVARCSNSTLAKWRKHKDATASYTLLHRATDATAQNPNQNQNQNQNPKEEICPPVAPPVAVPVAPESKPSKVLEFGEFRNCKLTVDQHIKLKAKLNGNLESYIDRYDRWLEEQKDPTSGKLPPKYRKRQAYLSIANWFERDLKEGKVGTHLGRSAGNGKETPGSTSERRTSKGDAVYIPKQ